LNTASFSRPLGKALINKILINKIGGYPLGNEIVLSVFIFFGLCKNLSIFFTLMSPHREGGTWGRKKEKEKTNPLYWNV
jgi:hypothetical protein